MVHQVPDDNRYFMIGTSYERAVDAIARKLAYIDYAESAWERYRPRAELILNSMPIAESVPAGAKYKGYRSANGVVVGGPDDILVDGDWLAARMDEKDDLEDEVRALGQLVGASKKDSLESVVAQVKIALSDNKAR